MGHVTEHIDFFASMFFAFLFLAAVFFPMFFQLYKITREFEEKLAQEEKEFKEYQRTLMQNKEQKRII